MLQVEGVALTKELVRAGRGFTVLPQIAVRDAVNSVSGWSNSNTIGNSSTVDMTSCPVAIMIGGTPRTRRE